GKEVWRTKLGDINKGETITMAPLVVKGKVLVGNSGGEFGVRGWLCALDAKTGKVAWRAYATGPDRDVLIGPRFKPFYPQYQGTDLGVKSWPPGQWQVGGGTSWGFISYDPALNLIFYGTANPGTWNAELRPGDNLWSCGVFARDPDTGEAVWYYQWTPHDLFDWDGINENVLVDLPMDGPGKPARKVLLHVDRNGMIYVVDRTKGEVISATQFTRSTAILGFDKKTARPIHNPEKHPKTGKVIRDVQPFAPGAKDWQPTAFSPRTGMLYVPHQNMSMDFEGTEANYIAGTPYVGAVTKFYAGPGGHRGVFMAWDPVAAKQVWAINERFPVWSGALATAGDVVFYGNLEGFFKAVNAKTGAELWRFKCGSGIVGQPTTFTGPDGKQYVAILSGVGGWAGAIVAGNLDKRDPTSALGMVNATRDLPDYTATGGTLYVFGLHH
ncbi:MAG TPA: PQQ-binding-like beta-propeller repeat protein, partial [Tepidisphaeraceae bacterium]|nr:PQQ-binding-like beta-propeller repeat protein [Tepidisphaeraceae bacterium]